jgi:hypothetical protein
MILFLNLIIIALIISGITFFISVVTTSERLGGFALLASVFTAITYVVGITYMLL